MKKNIYTLCLLFVSTAASLFAQIDSTALKTTQTDTVNIQRRQGSTTVNSLSTMKTEKLTVRELRKAACCSLGESFETNASVDVSFTDAVTGTKQIQMLGLSGVYTQLTTEAMPTTRGLAAATGLDYIPGAWVNSIQIAKGAGSVAQGYESMTGQINVELFRPEEASPLALNAYTDVSGRTELNAVANKKISEKWYTGLLAHGSTRPLQWDMNHDGFMDFPTTKQINVMNRWKYDGMHHHEEGEEHHQDEAGEAHEHDEGEGHHHEEDEHEHEGHHHEEDEHEKIHMESEFGVKALIEERDGGTLTTGHTHIHIPYRMAMNTRRFEGFAKCGFVFPRPATSLGLQLSGVSHDFTSLYGSREYGGVQRSAYANLIFQSYIGNTNHTYRTGFGSMYDTYDERVQVTGLLLPLYRREQSVGAFGEYSYADPSLRFTAVAGLRADWHNYFGVFMSPRMHLRYMLDEHTTLRASAGRGLRSANPFAENLALFASSRNIYVVPRTDFSATQRAQATYGNRLLPEIAWNMGINLTRTFTIDYRDGRIGIELYRTQFQSQVLADMENPREVRLYSTNGAYANAFQVEGEYEIFKRFTARATYKFLDSKSLYGLPGEPQQWLQRPYTPRHRAYVNLGYDTKRKTSTLSYWHFDLTAQWYGSKRVPSTAANPETFQRTENAPSYLLLNGLISRTIGHRWEVYLGGENLLNVMQHTPIIAAAQPTSDYFDASMIWGPIFGRMAYIGVRWDIKEL